MLTFDRCRHGSCCRDGLDKPPLIRKKDTNSSKAPRKDTNLTTSSPSNNKPSPPFNKITKSGAIGTNSKSKKSIKPQHNTAGLERLHDNALGCTKPATLLSKTTSTFAKALPTIQTTSAVYGNDDDFDETWLDEIDKFETLPSSRQNKNMELTLGTTALHHKIEERKQNIRRPVKRIFDCLSDDEFDDIDMVISERRLDSGSGGRRQKTLDQERSTKRPRNDQEHTYVHDGCLSRTVSPAPRINTGNQDNSFSKPGPQDSNVEANSPIELDEEIIQASQDLAAYKPFKNMDGIDVDFMAQFAGCCEFVE